MYNRSFFYVYYSIFIIFVGCSTYNKNLTNKNAINIFKTNLSLIKEYLTHSDVQESNFNYKKFEQSLQFMSNLTNIPCTNYVFENFCGPTFENYRDWEAWLKLNKSNLYINKDEVCVKSPKPLIKNPQKYYIDKLNIIEKSIRKKLYEDPEYIDALSFLKEITKIKTIRYNSELQIEIPSYEDIEYFKNWFRNNKSKLYWDTSSFSVDINKQF